MRVIVLYSLLALSKAWDYSSYGLDWVDSFETCSGQRQSPINIARDEATVLSTDKLPILRKACGNINGKMLNDGNILKFQTNDGKARVSDREYLSGGPLGSDRYFFLEFYLHWGSSQCNGSEHTIDNIRLPAELQLLHVKEDFVSADGTVDYSNAFAAHDGFAILSIFIEGGADNSLIHTGWFDVIANTAMELAVSTETSVAVNMDQIVQRINPTYQESFNYWYYNGSLSTPGCQESVIWIVAEKALQVTNSQV